MPDQDFYQTLGVTRDATAEQIKRAYRKLARKYHPDVSKAAGAAEKFQAVGTAYDVLRDPEKRTAYDQYGADWQNPNPQQHSGWNGGFGFSPEDRSQGKAAEFEDFFQAFRAGEFSQPAQTHVRLELDLADIFAGARKTITIRLPQNDPRGRVTWHEKTIAVQIPKGVTDGQHIRLKGQGIQGADLIAEIALRPHPTFRVDGRDIDVTLPISPWEAALGARVSLQTPGGKVQVTVPPNARSGQRLRLKGRGLPGRTPGDLFAALVIVNPPVKTDAQREAFEHMARAFVFDPRKTKGV